MMKIELDHISQSLLDRVRQFELEKAEQRQRHCELERKARQARNTKKAANDAQQARQALKHPDLLTTGTKAARRTAARRLQKAELQAHIAMVEDWKCRLIAEFAAEDLAAFDAIDAVSQDKSETAPRPQANKPNTVSEDPIRVARSSASDLQQPSSAEDASRGIRPAQNYSESNRPIVESWPDFIEETAEGVATAEPNSLPKYRNAHSAGRTSDQEILPPIGGRYEQYDDTQKDLF